MLKEHSFTAWWFAGKLRGRWGFQTVSRCPVRQVRPWPPPACFVRLGNPRHPHASKRRVEMWGVAGWFWKLDVVTWWCSIFFFYKKTWISWSFVIFWMVSYVSSVGVWDLESVIISAVQGLGLAASLELDGFWWVEINMKEKSIRGYLWSEHVRAISRKSSTV